MNFLTNSGTKIVDEVGEIPGEGQRRFYLQMIANVLSLNEMNKIYQVTFNSGYEHDLRFHIGDKIVKFPDNYDRIYLGKSDKNIFMKFAEENKMNIIE